jgi:hypothetical protein
MTLFSKIVPFVEIYCKVQQATGDNTVHAHRILGTLGYKHTLLEYVELIAFLLQQLLDKCPRSYILHTWNLLFEYYFTFRLVTIMYVICKTLLNLCSFDPC